MHLGGPIAQLWYSMMLVFLLKMLIIVQNEADMTLRIIFYFSLRGRQGITHDIAMPGVQTLNLV